MLFRFRSLARLSPVLLTFLLLASGTAHADVNFAAPGVAESVTGLVVGSDTYDVTFVNNVTHAGWASQLDFTTYPDAEAAINALAAELNAEGVTALRFTTPGGGTFDFDGAALWYAADATTLYGESLLTIGSSWTLGAPGPLGSTAPLNGSYPFALDFVLAPAPSVPVLPPVGLGMLVVGLLAAATLFGLRARPASD